MSPDEKAATSAEISALFKRTFGAVILSLLPGGGGYTLTVVSGQDHDTSDEEYALVAKAITGLGALADSLDPSELFRMADAVESGGKIEAGLHMVEEDGPTDLAEFFRMAPMGRA